MKLITCMQKLNDDCMDKKKKANVSGCSIMIITFVLENRNNYKHIIDGDKPLLQLEKGIYLITQL